MIDHTTLNPTSRLNLAKSIVKVLQETLEQKDYWGEEDVALLLNSLEPLLEELDGEDFFGTEGIDRWVAY